MLSPHSSCSPFSWHMIGQNFFIPLEIRYGIWLDLASGMHMLTMLLPDMGSRTWVYQARFLSGYKK